ncbi:MAG: acyltransferase [Clostridiales bacterium]|nr:acyltransferase [Clostridiales bacterium]
MEEKKQYYGLDVVKFVLALLIAGRHMVQVFYAAESPWRLYINYWLSNLGVPVFFTVAGFLLFRKAADREEGSRMVARYCWRIFKLYVLWCVIYWPIDIYNWYHGTATVAEAVKFYIWSFFCSSTIAQLWYLPGLIEACAIVWACYLLFRRKVVLVLVATGILFAMGCIGDNWYFTQFLPFRLQQIIYNYGQIFITMRNGVFYGSFYVALGLLFAKKKWQLPFALSAVGTVCFLYVMYREARHCSNINMVVTAAPTAFLLVEAALKVDARPWAIYSRLRAMSEWIYLSHFYFFYFFSWSAKNIPFALTEFRIMCVIFVPMVAFAYLMARLAERYRWIGRLI